MRDSHKDSRRDSPKELKDSKVIKKTSFQDIVDSHLGMVEMKGSTTLQPTYSNHVEHRVNRKISASEIIFSNEIANNSFSEG